MVQQSNQFVETNETNGTNVNKLNFHQRDKFLAFDEKSHTYKTDRCPYFKSVTSLISSLFGKFDSDKVIKKMMDSPKWPRSEYFGMTAAQIKRRWSESGFKSRTAGTSMHEQIEKYFVEDEMEMDDDDVALKQFLDWDETKQLEIYRTEWRVFDDDLKLAGTIDAVFRKPNGKFVLVDWKRCKEIRLNNKFDKAKDQRISHLPDCNFVKYSIQLNIYARILEVYGIDVEECYIVNFHPNQATWKQLKALNLKSEVDKLLPRTVPTPVPTNPTRFPKGLDDMTPIKVEGILYLKNARCIG